MAALKAAEIAASTDPDWRQVRVLMVSDASSTMQQRAAAGNGALPDDLSIPPFLDHRATSGGRSAGGVRGAVSTGRKFGEHHCRALPSAFVVAHFADRFARRLHCQLADLALGLPRCLTFLPREGKAAGHSLSAVDDLSVPGAEQRVPIWSSQSVSKKTVPRPGWRA
jgi:hypothetical protein